MFRECWSDTIFRFVDIGGIVDNHCSNKRYRTPKRPSKMENANKLTTDNIRQHKTKKNKTQA
jgi:hypothetical protein